MPPRQGAAFAQKAVALCRDTSVGTRRCSWRSVVLYLCRWLELRATSPPTGQAHAQQLHSWLRTGSRTVMWWLSLFSVTLSEICLLLKLHLTNFCQYVHPWACFPDRYRAQFMAELCVHHDLWPCCLFQHLWCQVMLARATWGRTDSDRWLRHIATPRSSLLYLHW